MSKGLETFFFATSVAEANEAAFKTARQYRGKYKIISRCTSHHGSTASSIAATGDPSWITRLIIAPPLIITKGEIDNGVNVLDKSLDLADNGSE